MWRALYVSASIPQSLASGDVSNVFLIQQCLSYLELTLPQTLPCPSSEAKLYSLLPDAASEPLMTTSCLTPPSSTPSMLPHQVACEGNTMRDACLMPSLNKSMTTVKEPCELASIIQWPLFTQNMAVEWLSLHVCNLVVITVLLPLLVPVFIPI